MGVARQYQVHPGLLIVLGVVGLVGQQDIQLLRRSARHQVPQNLRPALDAVHPHQAEAGAQAQAHGLVPQEHHAGLLQGLVKGVLAVPAHALLMVAVDVVAGGDPGQPGGAVQRPLQVGVIAVRQVPGDHQQIRQLGLGEGQQAAVVPAELLVVQIGDLGDAETLQGPLHLGGAEDVVGGRQLRVLPVEIGDGDGGRRCGPRRGQHGNGGFFHGVPPSLRLAKYSAIR